MVVANKKEILGHVFKNLEIPEEVQDFFTSTWQIKSVGMLINLEQDKMMDQEEIAHGHVAAIALFIEWLKQYIADHEGKTPINWEFELTEKIWEDYILHSRGANRGGGIGTTTDEGSNSSGEMAVDETTTRGMSNTKVDPIKLGTPFVENSPFNNILPLVKLDVRSYPEFPRNHAQECATIILMHMDKLI